MIFCKNTFVKVFEKKCLAEHYQQLSSKYFVEQSLIQKLQSKVLNIQTSISKHKWVYVSNIHVTYEQLLNICDIRGKHVLMAMDGRANRKVWMIIRQQKDKFLHQKSQCQNNDTDRMYHCI